MDETVSESVTGQCSPKPTREERDNAYSSGAGRKAIEIPLEEELHDELQRELAAELPEPGNEKQKKDSKQCLTAPVGTELETKAAEIDDRIECH